MSLLLAIDAGTTSVKVSLFAEAGGLVASSLQEYGLLTPHPDWVELPPAVYWHSSINGVREVLRRSEAKPEDIVVVSVTSQGETLIPVNGAGRPLHNAIVWLDNRARTEAQAMTAAFDPDQFYRTTGQPEITPTWPACKILWLRQQQPDIFARTAKYLLVEDYLLYQLSGHYVTEGGVCTSTGYFDIRTGSWWSEY